MYLTNSFIPNYIMSFGPDPGLNKNLNDNDLAKRFKHRKNLLTKERVKYAITNLNYFFKVQEKSNKMILKRY